MDTDEQDRVVEASKTRRFVVKLNFEEIGNTESTIKLVKNIIFEKLIGNCLNVFTSKDNKIISFAMARSEDAQALANFDFKTVGLNCVAKVLTENEELDKRKIKICRPATGFIDIADMRSFLRRYGELDEFYEMKSSESRKRTFVVAFTEMDGKDFLLGKGLLFIGKYLFKIEEYKKKLTSDMQPIEKLKVRISNIPASTTEFSISGLMKQMKASFWHMPVSKKGIKMRCIIASFNNRTDYENALAIQWKFEGRDIVVNDVEIQCCFICGDREHQASSCPKKPSTKIHDTSKQVLQYKGKNWQELSEDILKKNNHQKLTSFEQDKNEAIEKLIREHEETKRKLALLEEENRSLRESITTMREEINTKISKSIRENEMQFKAQDSKIDKLCAIVTELSSGISSMMERIENESMASKLSKKAKSFKHNHDDFE